MPRKTRASKKPAAAEVGDVINISDDFDLGDSGASKTFPLQCSSLRKGGHVMLKGQPCKIVEMSTSQPGKHGHAKVHIVGMDIFSGKKYEDICPSSHSMSVPHVKREDYQVIGVWDEYVNLLDNKGVSRSDVRLPEGELGKEICTRFEADEEIVVTLMTAMDQEMICGLKKLPK
ncbi:eukaryotic translation initiation factor 5A-1-like [Acanthaster planci]|uniref:Eukaryotic translation initiation factor 5A n=1 Tax=Acanthaster planci TaxID=133434 RepID=A0A8B7YEG3_ACAPL|nr:eukaryotic translation initiation factor 5A-1-like [Acanthaster planci]